MSSGAANAAMAAEKRMAAQKMSVADLRLALAQAGVDSRNALEKNELVNLYVSNIGTGKTADSSVEAGAKPVPTAARRKAPAAPAPREPAAPAFKLPKEIADHVNWPNAFLVLLFALYLFNNVGSSYSGAQDDSGLSGADAASRAVAYLSGEVLDVPTNGEYKRLLSLHTIDTGLPVVVDFYSQSCGPCRQIAPYYKALAKDMAGEAVFLKVDVNKNRATATEAQVRAMPTFHFYQDGKLLYKFSGADGSRLEQAARQLALQALDQGIYPNQDVTPAALSSFLTDAGASDPTAAAANYTHMYPPPSTATLVRALLKDYPNASPPDLTPRPLPGSDGSSSSTSDKKAAPFSSSSSSSSTTQAPLLSTATASQLADEIAKRRDEEDAPAFLPLKALHSSSSSSNQRHPEAVVVIGSGPAGLSASLYAARAGLKPLMLAPSEGGQLLGKGVDVENYPGVVGYDATGRGIISLMRAQAASFGVRHVAEAVLTVETIAQPAPKKGGNGGAEGSSNTLFKVTLNDTAQTSIYAKTVIAATGASSRWLGVAGEAELRGGGGVSACATCDGYLFRDQPVVVVGGGDTAMEDALVLARTSSKVTVLHRRGSFRASHALASKVLAHPKITVIWHASVTRFIGSESTGLESVEVSYSSSTDAAEKSKKRNDMKKSQPTSVPCKAAFVAIGHDPISSYLKDSGVAIGEGGYVVTNTSVSSTATSVPGIFAAGDVADQVYRQAVTSAGSGAMAALDAERYLSEHA